MIDKRLLKFQGMKSCLCLCGLLTFIRALCMVGQAYSLAYSIVQIWYGAAFSSQYILLAIFVLCFVVRQLCVELIRWQASRFAMQYKQLIRKELLDTLFSQGAPYVASQGSSQCVQTFIEQASQIEHYLELMISKVLAVLIIPFVLFISIAAQDLISGIIALVAFPFIVLYMVILGKSAQEEADRQYQTYQQLSQHFFDSVRGMRVLQLAGRSWGYVQKIYDASEKFRETSLRIIKIATLSSTVLDLFATGALAAVSIMLGFRLVSGSLEFFPALVVLMLVPEYFLPVREFASDYHATLDGKTALASYEQRVQEFKRDCIERQHAELKHVLKPVYSHEQALKIELKALSKCYGSTQVLHGLNASFGACKKIGIIGASGSGKSSLLKILAGLEYPDGGELVVQDLVLDSLAYPAYQRLLAYIPQSPHIFRMSLADNLACYVQDVGEQELMRVVEDMGLSSLVETLPDGLDTLLGDGGHAVSGGQAQRIALARACLDPQKKLIILDEPSAQLDIETEYELKDSLMRLMHDKLVIFATHRLHWLEQMDEVYELKGGKLERVS